MPACLPEQFCAIRARALAGPDHRSTARAVERHARACCRDRTRRARHRPGSGVRRKVFAARRSGWRRSRRAPRRRRRGRHAACPTACSGLTALTRQHRLVGTPGGDDDRAVGARARRRCRGDVPRRTRRARPRRRRAAARLTGRDPAAVRSAALAREQVGDVGAAVLVAAGDLGGAARPSRAWTERRLAETARPPRARGRRARG